MTEPTDDDFRARMIERDMADGVKLPYADLEWYVSFMARDFHDTWRHVESDTIYEFVGFGLACTGNGKLALMVHYVPHNERGPMSGPRFERQFVYFKERFEPVRSRMVWDRV